MVAGPRPMCIGSDRRSGSTCGLQGLPIQRPSAFDRTAAMTLDELRRHLDALDRRLLQTIADRQATSREIARVKRATGYPTRDYARERDVIVGARSHAESIGVSPDVAETVIRLLIRSSLTTQEQASVAAHGGGAGKMGAWFTSFLTSQGFDVEVADPKAIAAGVKSIADWRQSGLTHDFIVVAAPLGATNTILQQLAQLKPHGVVFDLGSLKSPLRAGLEALRTADVAVTSLHPMFGPD